MKRICMLLYIISHRTACITVSPGIYALYLINPVISHQQLNFK